MRGSVLRRPLFLKQIQTARFTKIWFFVFSSCNSFTTILYRNLLGRQLTYEWLVVEKPLQYNISKDRPVPRRDKCNDIAAFSSLGR